MTSSDVLKTLEGRGEAKIRASKYLKDILRSYLDIKTSTEPERGSFLKETWCSRGPFQVRCFLGGEYLLGS